MPDSPDLLLMPEVAELTRLSVATLRYLRHVGRGPRSAVLGRRVAYKRADVLAWIEDQFAAEDHYAPPATEVDDYPPGAIRGGLLDGIVPDPDVVEAMTGTRPDYAPPATEPEPTSWKSELDVSCVVCPDCAFTFADNHYDDKLEGTYSCPACGERKARAEVHAVTQERDLLCRQVIRLNHDVEEALRQRDEWKQRWSDVLDARVRRATSTEVEP